MRTLIITLALCCVQVAWAQPEITFDSTLHHLGFFPPNASYKHPIVVYNTGNEPLVITAALANAGADVGSYPRNPIPPGGQDTLYFRLKTYAHPSRYRRSMTIRSNTENTVVHFMYYVKEQDPEEAKLAAYELGNNQIEIYLDGNFKTQNELPILHIEKREEFEYFPMYDTAIVLDSAPITTREYHNYTFNIQPENIHWNVAIDQLSPGWYRLYALTADGRKIYSIGFRIYST